MFSKMLKGASLFAVSATLLSCSLPGSLTNSNKGQINVGFRFPVSQSFGIKAIPANTESFEIMVEGEGLGSPIIEKVERSSAGADNSSSTTIGEVPVGSKTVTVKALGKDNETLAQASTETTIEGGKKSTVRLELKELLQQLTLRLNNYPSGGSLTLAQITGPDRKISIRQSTGKELEIEVPPGEITVKATVLNNDSTPLSTVNTKINIEPSQKELSVNLNTVSIPETIDLPARRIRNGEQPSILTLGEFIPKPLVNLLDNVLIPAEGNKAPELSEIEYSVNSSAFTRYQQFSYINVKPGDNLQLRVKATDADGDPVKYFWGVTTIREEEDNYKMRLLKDQREASFSETAPSQPGAYFVGFLMLDKKSYSGPYTVMVNVE